MPWKKYYKRLVKLVNKGVVAEETVDRAVARVLRKKIEFAHVGDESLYSKDAIGSADHRNLALEVARKSMVLVKNDTLENGSALLPLDTNTTHSIAVIGRLADQANIGDDGSSIVRPDYVVTPLEGLQKLVGDSLEIEYCDGSDLDAATRAAQNADVAVVITGYDGDDEGEYMIVRGGDRASLTLRESDEALILAVAQANPRTAAVIIAGSAIVAEAWRNQVPAILMAWYPGMEGGTAIAETLFGNSNPGGKLPVVFPVSEKDLPHWDIKTTEIEYGYFHGYRLLDHGGIEPAWPFGHGLSYTTFEIGELSLAAHEISANDSLELSVSVQNTGSCSGDEVIQVYVAPPRSDVDRAPKELKSFERVHLGPGESARLSIEIPAQDLAYYDEASGTWVVQPGTYSILAGNSSSERDLSISTFTVTV